MWTFLTSVLEQGGVVAALFFLLTFGFGWALRALWNQNQSLHKQLKQQVEVQKKMVESYAQTLRDQADKHTLERQSQADDGAKQLLGLSKRIDELQERRVQETQAVTEKVVSFIGHIDQFANKLEATIDIWLRATGEQRR